MRELTGDEITQVAGGYAGAGSQLSTRVRYVAAAVSSAAFAAAVLYARTSPTLLVPAMVLVTIGGITYLVSQ